MKLEFAFRKIGENMSWARYKSSISNLYVIYFQVSASIVNIDKNAFAHVPSISSMDLSNNRISVIHSEAFKEVGNALQHLKMSNALYFTKLPELAFHSLSAMITLDLSDNHIRNVPLDSFHKMSQLKFLYLQVCWYFSNLQ